MGQFMGWASYDLVTRCGHCGEEWPRDEDTEHWCQEGEDYKKRKDDDDDCDEDDNT